MELDEAPREVTASLRHLKLFESVARLKSVRGASEECHLSQPAVTQAIAKLEEQIGMVLLERRSSGTYLNDLGAVFQRRVQRLFEQLEQALIDLGLPDDQGRVRLLASRITRSQIRALAAIVENGSFPHAARALGLSQAALQRGARDLERTLRTPLYVQSAQGVMATPHAAELSRKLKLAMRELDAAIEELDAARGDFGGEIVIGAMLMAGSVVLASVLEEFVTTFPKARVRILSGTAEDMLTSLRGGDVDFVMGLLRDPAPEEVVNVPLAKTPYVVVARQGHPLTRAGQVGLQDLAGYDWVIGTPGSSRRAMFETLFADTAPPSARVQTCALPIIRLLLSASDRLTLLTSYELVHEEDALAAIPFGPMTPAPSMGLTVRQNWLPTQLQASFIALVQKRIVGTLQPRMELRRAS